MRKLLRTFLLAALTGSAGFQPAPCHAADPTAGQYFWQRRPASGTGGLQIYSFTPQNGYGITFDSLGAPVPTDVATQAELTSAVAGMVTTSGTQTLTNKTLSNPTVNGGAISGLSTLTWVNDDARQAFLNDLIPGDLNIPDNLGVGGTVNAGEFVGYGSGLVALNARALTYKVPPANLPVHAGVEASVDRRVTGREGTEKALFSSYTAGTSYTRSSTAWASDCDLTPISVWNTTGGALRGGIAISSSHILFANHYAIATGATVHFVGIDGALVTRTITSQAQVGATDLQVARLNTALPSTVTIAKVLPDNYDDLITFTSLPALVVDQEKKALIVAATASGGAMSWAAPAANPRLLFYEALVTGDSGAPVCLIVGDELVVVSIAHTATTGPDVQANAAAIESVMASLGGLSTTLTRLDSWRLYAGGSTITASQISDASTAGRALITAASPFTELGLGAVATRADGGSAGAVPYWENTVTTPGFVYTDSEGQLSVADAQPLDADLTDLADGSLTGSKVGTGIDAGNITTGTLAVANGGTGVTTSTGTGSVVLSASPTFTGPLGLSGTSLYGDSNGVFGIGGLTGSVYAAHRGVFLAGRSAQNTGAQFYVDAVDNTYLYAGLGNGKTLILGDATRPFTIAAGFTGISHGSGSARLYVPANDTLQMGQASATPSTQTIRGQSASGTNITGGTLALSAGPGTGSAASGDIVFQTHGTGGASGTTAGTPVTRMTIAANGVATFAANVLAPSGLRVGSGTGTFGALIDASSGLLLKSTVPMAFSSATNNNGDLRSTIDAGISRIGPASLAVGNGTVGDTSGTMTAKGQRIVPGTAPAAPATGWTIYCDSGDGNKLKAIYSSGTIVTLGTP